MVTVANGEVDTSTLQALSNPIVIDQPGNYTFDANTLMHADSIVIASNDVNCDFQNNKVCNKSDHKYGTCGILIEHKHKNIQLKNGIFEGHWWGLHGENIENCQLRNMSFNGVCYVGIHLTGQKILMHDCSISDMNYFVERNTMDFYLIGLNISADVVHLEKVVLNNNHIEVDEKTIKKIESIGILLAGGTKRCHIEHCSLINNRHDIGDSYGIWTANDTHGILIHDTNIENYLFWVASNSTNFSYGGAM